MMAAGYQSINSSRGFTIVELMISITVLSVVLLLCSAGIARIGQVYYKGIISASTQQTSRNISDDIARSIQFSGGEIVTAPNVICIGELRYTYVLNAQSHKTITDPALNLSRHVLWRDTNPSLPACIPVNLSAPIPSPTGSDMVGEHMRLTQLDVVPSGTAGLYSVNTVLMYGDNEVIDMTPPAQRDWFCKNSGGFIIGSFCARSEQSTVVGKRLR